MKISDTYTACSVVEGFAGDEHDPKTHLKAWAYLVKNGQAWKLQGWYGRTAQGLIDAGYITQSGKITQEGRQAVA